MTNQYLASTFLFITALCLTNCTPKQDCCAIVDTTVRIYYQTPTGENLIGSSNTYSESGIKIYYKNGETFEYAYQSNLDYPNMYYVSNDEQQRKILTVFPSNQYEGNYSTTLIQLNEQTRDTLRCEFDLGDQREVCKKAWLNGVEMENRFIAIKKP